MKLAISYATEEYSEQLKYNTKTAYEKGKFDKVIEYGPKNIDADFYEKTKHILTQKRGAGYWLWKPYCINKAFSQIDYGDYLFYCDASAFYTKSIDPLINCMEKNNEDIMVFELPLIEKQWTKKDAYILMDCIGDKYSNTNQILASYILLKKTINSELFISEYLDYCCKDSILTAKDNEYGENFDGFMEHRFDQSVLSLLSKKYNLIPHRDPSQFGDRPEQYNYDLRFLFNIKEYNNSNYPRCLILYRSDNKYIRYAIELLKDFLPFAYIFEKWTIKCKKNIITILKKTKQQ